MFKLVKRWWKYLTAKLSGSFDERADPKVQLQQAILESQQQHQRLTEQAANVIATQKQHELRLNRQMDELEKLNGQARQAVLMADEAAKRGDTTKATEYAHAAETIATRLIAVEADVEELKKLSMAAAQASDQAKNAVKQNATLHQRKLSEQQKLLGQLEQAKMQEQMNKALASLSQTVGEDVPSLDEVRTKIEARYAKASGMSELQSSSVESSMLEIEQAAQNVEATARLAEIRAQLGIAPAPVAEAAPTPEVGTGSGEPEGQPTPAPGT
jgi:phage shock protein A